MDENALLQGATPHVFFITLVQTLSLMVFMRIAWMIYVYFNKSEAGISTQKEVKDKGISHHWRIMRYVKHGYRKSNKNLTYCICSSGCMHNETCNIWTHIFAALYFFNCYLNHPQESMSKFVALAAGLLFAISTMAHTCSCHSAPVEKIMFRIDRASIAIYFTVFVIVAGYQHFFQSRGEEIYFYIFSIFSLCAGITSSSMMFVADNGKSKLMKVAILSSMLLCVLIPVLRERYYSHGALKELKDKLVLLHLPTSLAFGMLGGVFFASSQPEKYFVAKGLQNSRLGMFFQYFNSHSIMHVMVFASAWIGYSGQSKWDVVLKYEKEVFLQKQR